MERLILSQEHTDIAPNASQTLSVPCPTNHACFRHGLEAILTQSRPATDIVIDDASTDNSLEVLETCRRHPASPSSATRRTRRSRT
jgi:hypothetical protein